LYLQQAYTLFLLFLPPTSIHALSSLFTSNKHTRSFFSFYLPHGPAGGGTAA
jgi:hypothetical protein